MQPHQQRVIDEKQELDNKIEKLNAFTNSSEIYKGLPVEDQKLLQQQKVHMANYSLVLAQRIARL